ncbi:unnamed protein product, partial [Tenebrio molitor]
MSFRLLKYLFKVGKFLAITPSSLTIAKATLKEKIYGSSMIGLYTVALVVSLIYRVPQYSRYIHIKLTIHVILDIMLYTFCVQAIMVALLKRHLWYKLIRNLKITRDNKFPEKNYFPAETVDIFNDVFGWSILLNILHGSLQMVIYLDDALAGNAAMSLDWMISDVSIILLYCTGTVVTILLCDSVLYETEHILTVTYKLEKYLPDENKEQLHAFINTLTDNFPQFSAARFFVIDKSTILKIFNAVLTFFIIIIQFENN